MMECKRVPDYSCTRAAGLIVDSCRTTSSHIAVLVEGPESSLSFKKKTLIVTILSLFSLVKSWFSPFFIYACTSFGNFSILHLLLLGGRRRQFSPFICIVRLTKTGSAISVFSAAIKARLQFIGREETKYSPFYNKHTDTQGKGELPEF